jgi:hypothetical protein
MGGAGGIAVCLVLCCRFDPGQVQSSYFEKADFTLTMPVTVSLSKPSSFRPNPAAGLREGKQACIEPWGSGPTGVDADAARLRVCLQYQNQKYVKGCLAYEKTESGWVPLPREVEYPLESKGEIVHRNSIDRGEKQ